MPDVAVCVDQVGKRFRRGQLHDSLRDLIPAAFGTVLGRRRPGRPRAAREFWALQDVSFEVGRGEAFGIIGPNGAGKSTMLKLLSRLMKPTRGSIEVSGSFSALIELGAGFHRDLTGRENIYLYGTILGMTRRQIAAKFDRIVDFAGLSDFIDTPVKRYSSGMYARLGFSVAAHVNPDVLLVDEILSVGDDLFQQRCIEHMRSIIKGGATVLFVSHNLRTVAEFCPRSLLLDHGRAVAIGATSDVIAHYLSLLREHRATSRDRPVVITDVRVRNASGACNRFQSGRKAWIDIVVAARERCSKLAVVLIIKDSSHNEVFETSTERLGHGNFSLDPGETFSCTFELDFNLGPGVFYLCTNLFRYDTNQPHDKWDAAETIYIWSDKDITGPVNCFPKVVHQQVETLPSPRDSARRSLEVAGFANLGESQPHRATQNIPQ